MKKVFRLLLTAFLVCLASSCTTFKQGMYDFMINADRSRSHLETGTVTIDGQTIAYLERPGSGEVIVLVHGFGANKDNWVRFVRYIPAPYRVLAFDMPGHGDSSKLKDKTYSIDFMADSLHEAVTTLELERFHIAGNSMGGYISMLYTARNPDQVITMNLIDAAGLISETPQPSDLQLALERGESPLTPETNEEFIELLGYAFHEKPFIPWPITSVLAERAVASSAFTKKMWKDFHTNSTDIVPVLPKLDLPVLVIWGDKDRILHVSTTEVLGRCLPDVETIIMKDCGHMPMLERPKETAGHYVSFLSRNKRPE
ncbi:MAG TPA: alpha/beta hydrolase [Deltaproteobacteria bacterium]|nr:alpha/beta hydrolase [Deltaproteobacteria bacterium]